MRYLTIDEVITLHKEIIASSGGSLGIRDIGALESSLAQPYMTFDGKDLYPTLTDKASALGFSLIMNHPFIDGNKRIGHAFMEVFLLLNGFEIIASVDEQEEFMLRTADGKTNRESLESWLKEHIKKKSI